MLISTIVLCGQVLLQGQEGIDIEKLEVIKAFDAQLEEAVIVNVRPTLPKVIPVKKSYDYQISIVPIELEYPAPTIKPLAMQESNEFDYNNHFIRLGYGNLNNPNGRLGLSFFDGDRYRLSIAGGYNALDNTKNVSHQKMSLIDMDIDGFARLNTNNKLEYNVGLHKSKRTFFDVRSEKHSRFGEERDMNGVEAHFAIANLQPSLGDFNYKVGFDYALGFLRDEALGSMIGLNLMGDKRTSDRINILMPIELNFHTLNTDAENTVLFNTHFSPQVHYNGGRLYVKVGADVLYDTEDDISVWPELEFGYGLYANYVQVVLGTKQEFHTNTLIRSIDLNPFVDEESIPLNNTVWKDIYGGLRGELNFLSYQVEAGYKMINKLLLFSNGLNLSNTADMSILQDNVDATFLRGNIDFAISKQMNVGGVVTQNIYLPKVQNKVWGLPSFELEAYFNWKLLSDKLTLSSNLYLANASFTQQADIDGQLSSLKLNSLIELDAEIVYQPIKYFGLFIYAHNLLDNQYQRWHGLPNVGINFGGGLQSRF